MSKQREVLELIINTKKAAIIHSTTGLFKSIETIGGVYQHEAGEHLMLYYLDKKTGKLHKRSVRPGSFYIEVVDSSLTFFKEMLQQIPKNSKVPLIHLEEIKEDKTV